MVTLTGVGDMGMGNLPPGREKGVGFLKPRLGDTIQKARRTGTTGFRALLVFLVIVTFLSRWGISPFFFFAHGVRLRLRPAFRVE
jgi:hypothetical protein